MIAVLDYGMGNVGSVLNILKKVGAVAAITTKPGDLLQAEKIVLPGVGSFDEGMNNLKRLGFLPVLDHLVFERKIPILGICLGMQLFGRRSDEGKEAGLGWIDAESVRFSLSDQWALKIPHMGWNTVAVHKSSPLFSKFYEDRRFYFVHSYHVMCNDEDDVLATTNYGLDFNSVICRGNILGTQFHPEKSHRFGIEFFKRFVVWNPGRGC